ncbi:gamma-glutamyltransferase 1, Threonine peptidase, MEROPS family T03 [Nitrosococcus oceani ATCC 19707]|uniref:Glutathione hydrolase proenzyme n=2 Tax=Nitrosococcus oceani TaxID=1229 RepID=Q3JD14_NITOC|nr:gamma-glutamyltransferase [Nitrosococcus oceani]ABA57282.1 gamma-glutamyltransferase 1, Threonine peptidase, MEROPS family T03 [Nitrosococcus oceani ATCC 19707]EDZ67462.1 gamma-glutamyltransferase [Nitrosococcus oceani AFC27]KFI20258.1 gamma-glutamyltransferase [Nitrosococcus oceani C-27]GEM20156.1 gamma-glutamyltransferase [Nitrosococcus oceani]
MTIYFRIALFVWLIFGGGLGLAREGPPAAAIASAHPLATQAGHEVLAAGGNAFDAAVAVSAALAVVEPYSSGLGGGGFWLLHLAKEGTDVMLDGRERAPLAATARMYLDETGALIQGASIDGPLAAAIPGQPAALAHLAEHYGRLSLAKTLAPAMGYAREGFEVDKPYRRRAAFRLPVLKRWPAAGQVFLADGKVPVLGARIKQPALAATLEALAQRGAAGFYQGPVAEALVAGVRAAGGIWSREDLAQYQVVERAPVRGQYRGFKIISASPPSSGGIALLTMLNILAEEDLSTLPAATRTHLIIEAMRRAYRDRAQYLGDPDFVDVPVQRLTHPYYGAGLRAGIRLDRATSSADLPGIQSQDSGPHTTHFSVIDREGNRVAATLSINYPFGSGFMPPGTGVLLNDEMDDFAAAPGVPNVYGLIGSQANAIAPGKRPLSSMTPTFVENEQGVLVLGTPGGSRIITMVLLGVLEHVAGADLTHLVSQPRFHHQYFPDEVEYEPQAFAGELVKDLQALGHSLSPRERPWGNMQAVFWDRARKRVKAASDPRGVGEAVVR